MSAIVIIVYSCDTGENKKVKVPRDKLCHSEFFVGMLASNNNVNYQGNDNYDGDEQGKQVLTCPSQYGSQVVEVYVNYLNGDDIIIDLFLFCNFIIDDTLFAILVENLYLTWVTNSWIVGDPLLEHIQKDIYLHSPLTFVPSTFHTDMNFLDMWTGRYNRGRRTAVQLDDTIVYYHSDIETDPDSGHLICITSWHEKPTTTGMSKSVMIHGPCLRWYLSNITTTTNGKQQLMSQRYYKHHKCISKQYFWHPNGVISEVNDHDYDTGKCVSKHVYDENGKLLFFI